MYLIPLKEDKPKVIIRFDDYGVWCNKDWLEIEEEIIKLHEKYNIKLTYGVIPMSKYPLLRHTLSPQEYPNEMENNDRNPYPLTVGSNRVSILKESTSKGITEVALHGYFHPKGYSNTHKNTEFYNISYDIQYMKLHHGKKLLDSLFSTCVTTFIPPHNTYDQLTLDLLQELGMDCISAKQINFDAPLDDRLNIRYLWFTTSDFEKFKNIIKLKHYVNEPAQILALHHTNFTTDGIIDQSKIESYEHLLKYIADNNIPNYSFSNFPCNELNNNEIYYKAAYQNLLQKYSSFYAAKFLSLCKIVSPKVLILFVLSSFVLFIYGLIYCVLGCLKIRYNIVFLTFNFIIFSIFFIWLIYSLLSAYSLSIYNLYYILFSQKILLQLTMLAITLSIFRISIIRQKFNK